MADDLGYADVSCYGRRDYTTPNIDSLAAQGVMFVQAYANSAVCSATRTALITGRYQYRLPVAHWGNAAPGSTSQQVTISMDWLPTLLEAAGTRPDPAYPPDGVSLIPALKNSGPSVSRKLFWRYRANTQE